VEFQREKPSASVKMRHITVAFARMFASTAQVSENTRCVCITAGSFILRFSCVAPPRNSVRPNEFPLTHR
jgi:hypothetical protein